MKLYRLSGALFLLPLLAFANVISTEGLVFSPLPATENSVIKYYSNEQELFYSKQILQRKVDFPTQIIRTRGNVEGLQLTCKEVGEEISRVFSDKIMSDLFTYNIYTHCGYDPYSPEMYAVNFSIQSYFDPLTDHAVDYLKSWLQEYNGYKLFDTTPLQVENAKGLLVSINFNAGLKNDPEEYSLLLYRQDHNNFYFKSNYEMGKVFIADIYKRFYSNNPKIILPFMDKWIFPYASSAYYSVLKASDYLELQPERIFIMEKEGDIFVSDLRYYFANQCMKRNPNKHCL